MKGFLRLLADSGIPQTLVFLKSEIGSGSLITLKEWREDSSAT